MRKHNPSRKWILAALAIVVCGMPLQVFAQFPSAYELRRTSVSLNFEGFTFTSGLKLDSDGVSNGQGAETVAAQWAGRGFVVDERGTIVTNYHIARRALRGVATFDDGSSYQITRMQVYDPRNDVAVLKIDGTRKCTAVTVGNSDTVNVMDKVMSADDSFGVVNQLIMDPASGVLSRIRHTAYIRPESSGGALYKGREVVGVNVSVGNVSTVQSEYQNYAIPINIVKWLISKFPNPVPLESVFPPNLDGMSKKVHQISTVNGKVDATTDKYPGIYVLQFDLYGLEDYVISLQSPGKDLALAMVDPDDMKVPLGFSNYEGENEVLIYPNERAATVFVGVINFNDTPADFGLGLYNIIW